MQWNRCRFLPPLNCYHFPGNEVLEIRLRALKSVELQFKVYDHLNYNGPYLMKALINWFDFKPICEEGRVLHLIHEILKGDQRDDTIGTLGASHLKEKFEIIEHQLRSDEHKNVLRKILFSFSGQQSPAETVDDTLDDMSCISEIREHQTDDLVVDCENAFE